MMGKSLKVCSRAEVDRKLQKAGWAVVRQKGSHVMLTKSAYQWTLSIPQYNELGPGILRKLLRQANLSMKELNEL